MRRIAIVGMGLVAFSATSWSQTEKIVIIRDGVFYPTEVLETQVYYDGEFITPIPVTENSAFLTSGEPPSAGEMAWMLTTGIKTNDPTALSYLVSNGASILADPVKGKAYVDALNAEADPLTNGGMMPVGTAQDLLGSALDNYTALPVNERYPQNFSKTDLANAHWVPTGKDLTKTGITGEQLNTVLQENQDYSHTKFGDIDLSGWFPTCDLMGVDFTGTNMTGEQLNGAGYLHGAKLCGLDLTKLGFYTGKSFLGVDFTGARTGTSNMGKSDISGAILKGVDMTYYSPTAGACLTMLNFEGAKGFNGAVLNNASYLDRVILKGQQTLQNFDGSGKYISGTDFSNTNVDMAKMVYAYEYGGANFSGVADPANGGTITKTVFAQMIVDARGDLTYEEALGLLATTIFSQ